MHKENAWSGARNLLLVRMDTLGDILMTSPAIRAVRENLPASRLTLLTSSGGGQAAALLPELDRVMVHDPPWMKATPQRNDGTVDRRFIRHLRPWVSTRPSFLPFFLKVRYRQPCCASWRIFPCAWRIAVKTHISCLPTGYRKPTR